MTITVAIYDRAHEDLGDALPALGLDLDVLVFDKDGKLYDDGKEIDPAETEVDYFWLSALINRDQAGKAAFDLVVRTKKIGVLQTFNAGLDDPVYRTIRDKGIRVCNSSAQAMAISEYIFGQVLSLYQPLNEQRDLQAAKTWKITPFKEIWRTNWLIVGYGPIGQEVARKAKAFGAATSVVRRSPQTNELVDRAGTLDEVGEFARDADVIVLACPLNSDTKGLANAEFFAQAKEGAIILNIGRGLLIDDAALTAALDSGRLSHAVLDVFHTEPLPADDPLWEHPKVHITSHTSFAGSGGPVRWRELFLDNLPRFVRGEELVNEVRPEDIP